MKVNWAVAIVKPINFSKKGIGAPLNGYLHSNRQCPIWAIQLKDQMSSTYY